MATQETMPTPETMSEPMDTTQDPEFDGEWVQSPVDDATSRRTNAATPSACSTS